MLKTLARPSPKDRLIARTWPDTVVDEAALRVHIAALRKVLGDGRAEMRYVATVRGRGYSFVAPVTHEAQHPAPVTPDGANTINNLPVPLKHIVGRSDIVAALETQLAARRFLTIVGPGGIGKTTVAIAVAETVRASYMDGVWFVELASRDGKDLGFRFAIQRDERQGGVGRAEIDTDAEAGACHFPPSLPPTPS